MKHLTVRLYLTGALLAALAAPALADGNPIPWPKKTGQLAPVVVASPTLIVDGNPIPWPKKVTEPGVAGTGNSPALVADGNPIPWPKKASEPDSTAPSPRLIADGNPIPWPKK